MREEKLRVELISTLFIGFIILGLVGPLSPASTASSEQVAHDGAHSLADTGWPGFGRDERHTHLSDQDTTHVDGSVKWSFDTNNWIWSSAALMDDRLYFGSTDDRLYALDSENGTVIWSYKTGGDIISSPAIDSAGNIYVGSKDGYLYSFASDGSLRWRFDTGGDIYSSPNIGPGGNVYVGSYSSYFYAIDQGGNLKWEYKANSWFWSSPAIADNGTVYVGSGDDNVYAFEPDGTLKWNFTTGGFVYSSPAIGVDGNVYFGSYDGKLYSVDPGGNKVWSHFIGDETLSSPAIGDNGVIYIGSNDDHLYAVDHDGTERWTFKTKGDVVSSPAIGQNGNIYFGSFDKHVYALTSNGAERWNHSTTGEVYSSPAIGPEGDIYIGSWGSKLYSFTGNNQPPVPDIDIWREVTVNATVMGTPNNKITAQIYHGDSQVEEISVISSGPPESNSSAVPIRNVSNYTLRLVYNATHHGANPVRVKFISGNRSERIFELFTTISGLNQSETYNIDKELSEVMDGNDVYHLSAADSYDPDGQIVSYHWDFGDGETADDINVTHEFSSEPHVIVLTVTDDDQTNASASYTLNSEPDYEYVDIYLCIFGRKNNKITGVILEEGQEILRMSVVKDDPWGNKDSATFRLYPNRTYTLKLIYNATERGVNPVFVKTRSKGSVRVIVDLFKTSDGFNQSREYNLEEGGHGGDEPVIPPSNQSEEEKTGEHIHLLHHHARYIPPR